MSELKNYINKTDKAQKIGILIISIFCAFFIFLTSLFVVSGGAYATAETKGDESAVMKELSGLKINGKAFNAADYPPDPNGMARVLAAYEVGYSFYENKREAYGVILYVYNPAQLDVQEDSRNAVQMRAGKSERFKKYELSKVSESADKLFYKFNVKFSAQEKAAVLSALDSDNREYEISSIELYTTGDNAEDYGLSHTQIFSFRGYLKGMGYPDEESTLTSTLSYTVKGGIETISPEVHHTSWRPEGTNGNSEYTQDTIHSVYFAVDNSTAQKYDYLNSVSARWQEATTAPILVTGNEELLFALRDLIDKQTIIADPNEGLPEKFNFDDFDFKWHIVSPERRNSAGVDEREIYFGNDYCYNSYVDERIYNGHYVKDVVKNRINALYLVGYVEGAGVLSSEELETMIKEATINLTSFNDFKVANKYPSVLFEEWNNEFEEANITVGDKYTLSSEIIERNWWEQLFGGSHIADKTSYKNIKAIQEMTDGLVYGGSDKEASDRLYISERDYQDFKTFYDDSKKENKTVYILRYATSEYWRAEVGQYYDIGFGIAQKKGTGYIAQTNCYLGFDVIDLEYVKGDENYVIPVVMSPIDIFPELTPPPKEAEGFWKYAIGIIAGLTVLYVIYKVGSKVANKAARGF